MCGVLAFYNNNKSITGLSMPNAIDSLAHRGPDGRGVFFESFANIEITLAHLRLSILDLTPNASQPFIYQNFTLVFNGEVYNYQDLKNQLISYGYHFKSESDTEVIILGYAEWGNELFSKLNGMFSVIIFDSLSQKMVICRDQLGIKPLYYYYDTSGSFCFSSEAKSLIDSGILPDVNKQIISEYFQFRFREGNETYFQGIHEFPKGEIWEIQDSQLKKYDFKYHSNDKHQMKNYRSPCARTERLLLESLERQIRADVPIGFFLSGGVDSSLLVSIYAKEFGLKPNTFSVYFNNYEHSEQKYQRLMSAETNSNHLEYCSKHVTFIKDYIFSLSNSSAPHCIPNYTQVFQLAKLAKETVKVLISGEGADELFGGYHRYQNARISSFINKRNFSFYKRIPFLNKKINSYLFSQLPQSSFKLALEYLKGDEFEKFIMLSKYEREFKLTDDFNSFLLYDQDVYMRGLLERVDNMTMLAGIEARVPYLDLNLVNYINTLAFEEKVGYFERKRIIQIIAKKYLPVTIIKRPKIGFSIPIENWICQDFGLGRLLPTIVDERSRSRKIFNYDHLNELIKSPSARKKYAHSILFPALSLELWIRSVIEKEDIMHLAND